MLRVLLAGGGTAGHLNPALAIADIIKKHHPDAKFLFAGAPFNMESELVPKAGYDFAPIKVKGFQRKLNIKNIGRNIQAGYYLVTSNDRAGRIIRNFNPDIVIGTGGYVSGPILMKAAKLSIPTIIHEQNAFPGVTTKLLSKKVDKVMLTVEDAAKHLEKGVNYTVTGLPVRAGIRTKSKQVAREELGLDNEMCILSFGGSLGAGKINEAASELIAWHSGKKKINHIHGFGRMGKDTFLKGLEEKGIDIKSNDRLIINEYIHNMDTCMAAADLVICRSGASTLSELEAMGRGSILIPSPIVTANHQYHNAMVLANAGAAIVIEQKDVTSEKIIDIVNDFYENREKLKELSDRAKSLDIPDVEDRIYEEILSLI